jgi:hypothetical protein
MVSKAMPGDKSHRRSAFLEIEYINEKRKEVVRVRVFDEMEGSRAPRQAERLNGKASLLAMETKSGGVVERRRRAVRVSKPGKPALLFYLSRGVKMSLICYF